MSKRRRGEGRSRANRSHVRISVFTFNTHSSNDYSQGLAEVDLFTAAFTRVQLKRFHLATSEIFFMQTQIRMHVFLLLSSRSFSARHAPTLHSLMPTGPLLCQLISASDGCIVALCKSIYIGIAVFRGVGEGCVCAILNPGTRVWGKENTQGQQINESLPKSAR